MTPMRTQKTRLIILHEGDFLRMAKEGEWEYIERDNCRGQTRVA